LVTLSQLRDSDPAAILAVNQALQSPFISVQLAALKKAQDLPSVTVPEGIVGRFLADPSTDLQNAAKALVEAGKVADFDANAFRMQMMQRMTGGLLQGIGIDGDGDGAFDLNSLLGALGGGAGGDSDGGFDISSLMNAMGGGGDSGMDLSSLMGMFSGAQSTPQPSTTDPAEPKAHLPNGRTYLVADERALKRVRTTISRFSDSPSAPQAERLSNGNPPVWAIESQPGEGATPRWVESLATAGLLVPQKQVDEAEQARRTSEQLWGAAYADHTVDIPVTLVFHDGMLSRAEWGGEHPGGYPKQDRDSEPNNGPTDLLAAFMVDPTDDRLAL
jgi:hypothetical protein